MKRALLTIVGTALLFRPAVAQDAPAAFEAADVHVSPARATESGGFLPGGRLEFRATTLLRLISVAYSVPPDQVTGGPNWIDTDRFDVVAKAATSASQAGMQTMLQNLLTERFGLAIQHEEKPRQVYALVMARRGSPKESASEDSTCKKVNEDNLLTLTCRNTTMAALAANLPGAAPAYFTHPVVDRTDLKGAYDFKLEWVGRGQLPPGPDGDKNALSIYTSIEKQLGVRVELQMAPMAGLTVAKANRVPVGNPPGVAEKLGPPPTAFEVADVLPSRPGENEDFKMENGRIDARAVALKDLIQFAYDAEDDSLKGGEKWLESERFDIVAKTAPTASADTLRVMLQSLLTERFGLKIHKDRQPVTVYALTAVKPKLRDADPQTRTSCTMSMADGGRAYSCQNITMTQFAEKIRQVSTGYLDHPVVDLTGLKGSYDFTVSFAPQARVMGRGRIPSGAGEGALAGAPPSAADPTRGLTIFEAFDRQLGLKLAVQKQPMPVIVIDHVERKPTAN